MPLPNFLIIGAAKSGTTALHRFLRQHPAIFMSSRKEPNFFAFEGEPRRFGGPGDERRTAGWPTTLDAYMRLFETANGEKAIGEASPSYLIQPRAAERIRQHVPDARLIAILRHPAERAYSAYTMRVRDGIEPCASFADAIRDEERRIRENWAWGAYVRAGFYHAQLTRYADWFNRDRLRIYLYEDFSAAPDTVVREILRFLDLDDAVPLDLSGRYNESLLPKNRRIHAALGGNPAWRGLKPLLPDAIRQPIQAAAKRMRRLNLERPPSLDPGTRRELLAIYRDDTLALQQLLGRDLSAWFE